MNMEKRSLSVFDSNGRLILKAHFSNNRRSHHGEIQVGDHKFLVFAFTDNNWLWHHRYGHLNFKSLNLLSNKRMVTRLPQILSPKELCEECYASKQSRKAFAAHVPTKTCKSLELVYLDVCGPLEEVSIGENRYFVIFIDDFIRRMWVNLIKRKDEVLDVFRRFKVLIEKQSGKSFLKLRTDGGREYTSR